MRKFTLPTFEVWQDNDFEYIGRIDGYTCVVSSSGYTGDMTHFKLVVTDEMEASIALSKYSDKYICCTFDCDLDNKDDYDKLQEWYEGLQSYLDVKLCK